MPYKRPDTGVPNLLIELRQATLELNPNSAGQFKVRLNDNNSDSTFTFERDLCFDESNNRMATQMIVAIGEIVEMINIIKEHYDDSAEGQFKYVIKIINEVFKNSFDHAKSDIYAKFEFSKLPEGILFRYILVDKGPGIKQHLINLFTDPSFMEKFSNSSHTRYYYNHKPFQELIKAGDMDVLRLKYLQGEGESTRLEDQRGFFLGDILKKAIDAHIDMILRDNDYEHTFSNRGGYLSHDTIRALPYKLVWYCACFFPKKTS